MARNYAALPHEYLDEMESLSDEEFGRLCRALLAYSRAGKEAQLTGAERHLWKRVQMQEQRFQASYEKEVEARREAGKRGAKKRWHPMANDGTAIPAIGKNSQTETNTETNTETEPPDGGRNAPLREAPAAAVAAYLEKFGTLSKRGQGELARFAQTMGAEVCLLAMDEALDNGTAKWSYVKAILQAKQAQGVRTPADWDALEAARHHPPGSAAAPKKTWASLAREMEGGSQ